MFKLINPVDVTPMRVLAAPWTIFCPGQVVQLTETDDGNLVCELSNGGNPIGIVSDFKIKKTKSLNFTKMVSVWHQRMMFVTDEFAENRYREEDPLFAKNGVLTNQREKEDDIAIGRVIEPPENSYLTVLWL